MKVVSRDTNKIANLIVDGAYKFVSKFVVEDDEGNRIAEYDSLKALYSKWVDYEESKKDCIADLLEWISDVGPILHNSGADDAVKKLEAYERLKDKGFRFVKVSQGIFGGEIRYKINEESEEVIGLLSFLFGGKE